jgi:hypothetical protein
MLASPQCRAERRPHPAGDAADSSTASVGDQCRKVFDFPIDCVRCGVAALSPSTAVVVDHAELLRQQLGQFLRRLEIAEHAALERRRRSGFPGLAGLQRHHLDIRLLAQLLRAPDQDRESCVVDGYHNLCTD